MAQVVEDKRELVSPQAADRVALLEAFQEAFGGLLQQQVAHGVTQAVVDHLEAIDVQHQHRHWATTDASLFDAQLQAVVEQHAIGQTGDGVVMGQAFQLDTRQAQFFAGLADFGNIGGYAQHPQQLSVQ
ncbi:hypothetical protein D3C76_1007130 [compost metagenome]